MEKRKAPLAIVLRSPRRVYHTSSSRHTYIYTDAHCLVPSTARLDFHSGCFAAAALFCIQASSTSDPETSFLMAPSPELTCTHACEKLIHVI